jgi:hypothetical protein
MLFYYVCLWCSTFVFFLFFFFFRGFLSFRLWFFFTYTFLEFFSYVILILFLFFLIIKIIEAGHWRRTPVEKYVGRLDKYNWFLAKTQILCFGLLICLAIVQAWYSIDQVLMFSIKRDYFTLLDLGVFFYIMFLGAFIFFVLSELLLFIYEAAPDIQFIVKFFFFVLLSLICF